MCQLWITMSSREGSVSWLIRDSGFFCSAATVVMEAATVALFDRDFWLPFLNTTQEAAHISSMLHWLLEKKSVIVYRRDGRSKSPERQDEVQKECGKDSACGPGKPIPKFKCRDAAAWCYSTNYWVGLLRTDGERMVSCICMDCIDVITVILA